MKVILCTHNSSGVGKTTLKQELGRRFAYCLGLTPGSLGGDGGIDGYGTFESFNIYFQSKLSRYPLDTSFSWERNLAPISIYSQPSC